MGTQESGGGGKTAALSCGVSPMGFALQVVVDVPQPSVGDGGGGDGRGAEQSAEGCHDGPVSSGDPQAIEKPRDTGKWSCILRGDPWHTTGRYVGLRLVAEGSNFKGMRDKQEGGRSFRGLVSTTWYNPAAVNKEHQAGPLEPYKPRNNTKKAGQKPKSPAQTSHEGQPRSQVEDTAPSDSCSS